MVNPEIFHPGVPAVIQIQGIRNAKLTTFFRGYNNKQYLIIDHPLHGGRPINLTDDTPCIVRFIHEGEVIGFKSRVMAQVRSPAMLVFLKYPTSVETSMLRKSSRYRVQIEVVVAPRKLFGDLDTYPKVTMLNLSEGGCMVESYEEYEPGTPAYMTVFLPEQGRVDDVETMVKRCEKHGDMFRLGLAFNDLLDPNYEQVKGYLHLLESYQVRA